MGEYLKNTGNSFKRKINSFLHAQYSFFPHAKSIKYDDISYCLNSSSFRCIDCEGSCNYELARFRPKHGLRIPIRLIVAVINLKLTVTKSSALQLCKFAGKLKHHPRRQRPLTTFRLLTIYS